ncbi:MAG: hypothetical protein R3B82_08095 [Sandaracinaceae bacterium]
MRPAALLLVLALLPAPAAAQCRRECREGESRDPWGCCVAPEPAAPPRRPRTRTLARTRPEALVGDLGSVLADDLPTELYHWALAWLGLGRGAGPRGRAQDDFRRAAGAAAIFLGVAPDDRRAGRMRAALVEGLDRAGLTELADREAASLGGPRPDPEPEALRELRADTLLNLAWAHAQIGQRLDGPRVEIRRRRLAVARFLRAAAYYRVYVETYPAGSAAPGARSELANALIAAGEPLEAARVLEAMAEAVPARRLEGLRRAVDAHRRALEAEVAAGTVTLRDAPPPPSMRPPWTAAPEMPEAVRRLFDARERYLEASEADPGREPEIFRSQQLENALLLYRYARLDQARPRLFRVLGEGCEDPDGEDAAAALEALGEAGACERARAMRCEGPVAAPRCAPSTAAAAGLDPDR